MLAARDAPHYIEGVTEAGKISHRGAGPKAPAIAHARFSIGDVVRHRMFDFRGVIFDIDPVFANSEEWYEAIPEEIRPAKDQPSTISSPKMGKSTYTAYVSQQNLLPDTEGEPVDHPAIPGLFEPSPTATIALRPERRH